MKLLHTSDWHLGITAGGHDTFFEDQSFFIDRICDIAGEHEVDGILISGDVFNKSIASREALKLYDKGITHICSDLGIPVYIIAGNHDGAERLSSCSGLLRAAGLYVCGELKREPCVEHVGDTDIYMLPWITTDKVRTVFPEKEGEIQSLNDAYSAVLDEYRSSFREDRKNILLCHAFVTGAELSESERSAEIGGAAMVSADVFSGFDYVALGHIHRPQTVREGDSIMRYSGTPMMFSFGKEEKQEKSVTVIDTSDMSLEIVPVRMLHKRTTLTGTFDEIMKADYPEDVVSGYVYLKVTDSYIGLEALSALREIYPNLLEVEGKSFEYGDSAITLTVEELEKASDDPEEIFRSYCKDIVGEAPDDHIMELFKEAASACGPERG